jgi:hypothetical protein
MRKFKEMNILLLQRQDRGRASVAFTMKVAWAAGSPDDESYNSATVSRLKSVGLPASGLRNRGLLK